jgi:aminoglycoside phosphotransferase (APT) family kinase protein
VILHGDLHGYNLLVRDGRLRCVLDYDAISIGDHHYDLRYLPGLGSSIGFLVALVDQYERLTGRAVEPAPLLAWHIRTVLGDALWRSEAGVPLPDGGTVH